ncbi:hypothetical protein CVT25_006684 [Psilocybe cyanescens]|uniref:Uncharacterized protein n=1 Tax=Psilocybe cyanescens TaxID=93625 RepID=A0A409XIP1_PSICY|nr:hypothetical protein CVT25_006684 [Psilocybe cyanescens]
MSTPDIPIPVNVQENEISTGLNNSMLFNFLMEPQTYVSQAFTLWYMEEQCTFTVGSSINLGKKLSKKPANLNRLIVLSAISVLYLLCLLEFIVQWYYLDWVVVIAGDTQESIFWGARFPLSLFMMDYWLITIVDYHIILINTLTDLEMLPCLGTIIPGDCGPIVIFAVECSLFVATIVLKIKFSHITSDANVTLFNNISSALTFVSLGTAVITTFFIGYRIYSIS